MAIHKAEYSWILFGSNGTIGWSIQLLIGDVVEMTAYHNYFI